MDEVCFDSRPVLDVGATVAAESRLGRPGRPWVVVNMITSLDGATALAGRSGGLGGPGDREVFTALRAVCDVVVVGAGTVRAENYGPPDPDRATRAARAVRGQAPAPRLAVITSSLALDPDARLFGGDDDNRPIIYTVESAPAERRAALADRAEVVATPAVDGVDLAGVLADLEARGASVVLVEGGPSLNAQLVAADLVDELCWTIAPVLVGGESSRLAHGVVADLPVGMELRRLFREDEMLFARYVRALSSPASR